VGRRTKRIYTLGDRVKVRVKKTDVDKRLIDLVFADHTKTKSKSDRDWNDEDFS
jgi:ribonuclease R